MTIKYGFAEELRKSIFPSMTVAWIIAGLSAPKSPFDYRRSATARTRDVACGSGGRSLGGTATCSGREIP